MVLSFLADSHSDDLRRCLFNLQSFLIALCGLANLCRAGSVDPNTFNSFTPFLAAAVFTPLKAFLGIDLYNIGFRGNGIHSSGPVAPSTFCLGSLVN